MAARSTALAACLVLAAAAHAPAAAQDDLFEAVDGWLVRFEDRDTAFIDCIDALDDRRVRFQQITDANPAVSEPVREALNQIVEDAIPRRWATRASRAVGEEVRQGAFGNPDVSAREQIGDLAASPVTVRADVARNHLDVARLMVTVTVRHPDGLSCITRNRQFHFRVDDLSYASTPRLSARAVDIFDFDATLRDGLARTPPAGLPASATIPFAVTSDFAGPRCILSREAIVRELNRAAAELAGTDRIGSIIGTGQRGYVPIEEEEGEETPHLRIVVTRSIRAAEEVADSVAVVEFVWREGRRRSPGVARIVALPRGALEDCTGRREANPLDTFLANAEARGRYEVDLAALSDPFAVGDALRLDLDVGEPLHAFCWVLMEEGGIVLYPHGAGLAAEPFSAATYRFPEDFLLPRIALSDAGVSLFHCFVSPRRMPQDVVEDWLAAHGRLAILEWPEVERVSARFREDATVSEVWAWVRASAGVTPAGAGER